MIETEQQRFLHIVQPLSDLVVKSGNDELILFVMRFYVEFAAQHVGRGGRLWIAYRTLYGRLSPTRWFEVAQAL